MWDGGAEYRGCRRAGGRMALAAQLAAAVGRTAHWPDYASMLAQWPAPLAWLRWVLGI